MCVVGRLADYTRTEFIPEASSRPFILIYETHKDSPVRAINIYRFSPFVHTILTDHVRSRTTLYIRGLPANCMYTVGVALYGSARPQ